MRLRVVIPILLALAAAAGLVFGTVLPGSGSTAATTGDGAGPVASPADGATPNQAPAQGPAADSEASVTTPNGPQPDFPVAKLEPGQQPPQFVVVSFDGACKDELFQHFMQAAERNNARYTWFLSGLCLLPEDKRFTYRPPMKPAGYSAIGFGEPALIPQRIRNYSDAYNKGHEIGTHALGHFCSPGGVGLWNSAQWTSELTQFNRIIDNWRTYLDPQLSAGVPPLPFNSSEVQGIRTPCLEGKRSAMWPVWTKLGYRYDASNPGALQWPVKIKGTNLWEFPLQAVKLGGTGKPVLSMDYNFMCAQNNCSTKADAATTKRIEESTYRSLMAALKAVCSGNRAPFFVGNHLNTWVNGAYKDALTRFIDDADSVCGDVQFVTNKNLVSWLDAQDPATIAALRKRGIQTY